MQFDPLNSASIMNHSKKIYFLKSVNYVDSYLSLHIIYPNHNNVNTT